ncbi:MAG: hypothetical protein PUB69_03185 [Desulfovibrionaceae bacterium]|nr:hypothetical protein [Desulfovibrionaceae bacterium]
MAQRISEENFSFEERIQGLGNEELLDFWRETQQIEQFLRAQSRDAIIPANNYEDLIVRELQKRVCLFGELV